MAESADLSGLLALYRHLHAVDAPLPQATEVERLWATMMAHPGLKLIVADSDGLLVSCEARRLRPRGGHVPLRGRGLALSSALFWTMAVVTGRLIAYL